MTYWAIEIELDASSEDKGNVGTIDTLYILKDFSCLRTFQRSSKASNPFLWTPFECCVTTDSEIHNMWSVETGYKHRDQNHISHFELNRGTNKKQNASCTLSGCNLPWCRKSFFQVHQLRKVHSTGYHTRKRRNHRHRCDSLRRRSLCPKTRRKYDRDNQLYPARSCHSLQDLRVGFLRICTRSSARTKLWCLPRTRVDLPSQERKPGGTYAFFISEDFPSGSLKLDAGLNDQSGKSIICGKVTLELVWT